MKKTTKHGFTIVELVIVIAVIAILAAVLIPTFSNLIEKADFSADQQAVRNMNTTLANAAASGEKLDDLNDVSVILTEAGYKNSILSPHSKGYVVIWDKGDNKMLLVEAATGKVYKNGTVQDQDDWYLPVANTDDFIGSATFYPNYFLMNSISINSVVISSKANINLNGYTISGTSLTIEGASDGTFTLENGTLDLNSFNVNDNTLHFVHAANAVVNAVNATINVSSTSYVLLGRLAIDVLKLQGVTNVVVVEDSILILDLLGNGTADIEIDGTPHVVKATVDTNGNINITSGTSISSSPDIISISQTVNKVSNFTDLATKINEAIAGETLVIYLDPAGDFTDDAPKTYTPVRGSKVIIYGNDVEFDGKFYTNYKDETELLPTTLILDGINFTGSNNIDYAIFITAGSNKNGKNSPVYLTVRNCSFTNYSKALKILYLEAVQYFEMEGCSFDNAFNRVSFKEWNNGPFGQMTYGNTSVDFNIYDLQDVECYIRGCAFKGFCGLCAIGIKQRGGDISLDTHGLVNDDNKKDYVNMTCSTIKTCIIENCDFTQLQRTGNVTFYNEIAVTIDTVLHAANTYTVSSEISKYYVCDVMLGETVTNCKEHGKMVGGSDNEAKTYLASFSITIRTGGVAMTISGSDLTAAELSTGTIKRTITTIPANSTYTKAVNEKITGNIK